MDGSKKGIKLERLFREIKEIVENNEQKQLVSLICDHYNRWARRTPNNVVANVIGFHNRYRFWGNLEPRTGDISLIEQRADILKNKWPKIEEFYYRLEDYRSKAVLLMILNNWLTFSYDEIAGVKENCFKSYFDLDLLMCDEHEVFVDLGAYNGDTVEDYLETYGEDGYSKIYCYEILEDNVKKLHEKFDEARDIVIRPVGVSKEKGEMYLCENGTADAQALVSEGNGRKVETVSLDDDITEKITFIKTDIEGAERDALLGAREHIRKDRPKLAISIYHSNEDLLAIYELIEEIQPGYRFYLRYNGLPYFPTDYILIGLPE